MKSIVNKTIISLVFSLVSLSSYAFTLVIDAGHGGNDPGAMGTYSKEKNINLNVALKVGELVRANCPDVKVIYTRKSDVFVNLNERAAIANREKADLFISIHTNSLPNGRIGSGAETYSLGMARSNENLEVAKRENSVILLENNYQKQYAFNPNSSESYIIFEFIQDQHMKQSAELAKYIQNQYRSVGRVDKGVKQAGFLVLRETSMPSVLTELGFISNPSEEQYLNSARGTDELARCIYNGFVTYKNAYQRTHSAILANKAPEPEPAAEEKAEEAPAKKESLVAEVKVPVIDGNEAKPSVPVQETPKQAAPAKETPKPQTSTLRNLNNDNTLRDAPAQEAPGDEVVFKIQILTSNKTLRPDSQQFQGLREGISYFKEGNVYKYTYGSSQSYREITALKKTIEEKFKGCFVVALKGDQHISVQEAQNLLKDKR